MRTQQQLASLAAILVVLALGAHLFMHLLPVEQASNASAAAPVTGTAESLPGTTVLAGEAPALLAVPADVAPAPEHTGVGHVSVMIALCMAVLVATVVTIVLAATRRHRGPVNQQARDGLGWHWPCFTNPPPARPSRIDAGVVLIV